MKDVLDNAEQASGVNLTNHDRIFNDNLPNKSWVYRFIQRHPKLAARTPEHLGHMRKNVTENRIRSWFADLKTFLQEEHQIDAERFLSFENADRVFNLDESGFALSGSHKLKVISETGTKNVYNVSSESKEQITVLGCVAGNGTFWKPYVIFPGVRPIFRFKTVDPEKYHVGHTPNGWISSDAFFTWLSTLFIREVQNAGVEFPILIFMDEHSSHINIAVAEFCRNNNIILYCLPPHSSHIMQPLDISVYGPLKHCWNKALTAFKEKYNDTMNKSNFFVVFDEAWQACKNKPENVIAGFRKAGLIPFNSDAPDYSKIINESASAKEYNQKQLKSSDDQRIGLNMALKTFEKHLSPENLTLFHSRINEGWDNHDNTDLCQMYEAYRAIKNLVDNHEFRREFHQEDQQASSRIEDDLSPSPVLNAVSANLYDLSLPSTSGEQLTIQSIFSGPSSPSNQERESSSLPSSSNSCKQSIIAPDTSAVMTQNRIASTPKKSQSKSSFTDKNPSNPKFYGSFNISPFKSYLKIDEKVVMTRKECKSKVTMPHAVSGLDYYNHFQKKQEEKAMEKNGRKHDKRREKERSRSKINSAA